MKKLNKLHVYHITGTDPKSNRKIVETRDIIENRNNIYIHISIFVDLIMLPPPPPPPLISSGIFRHIRCFNEFTRYTNKGRYLTKFDKK